MTDKNIGDVIDFLVHEPKSPVQHQHHHGHASHFSKRSVSQMDPWSQCALLDQLLCIRTPEPDLPHDIAESLDHIKQERLAHRLAVSSSDVAPCFRSSTQQPSSKAPNLSIWKGDITTLAHATAIVNAANSQMLGCFQPRHRCIDNAIHTAAGPGLRRECWELMSAQGTDEPEGLAKVTKGFNLHAKYVIHTVGPQLRRGQQPTAEHQRILASCYTSCLDAAENLEPLPDGRKVVVFCGISTGVFGFPADQACVIAVDAVLSWIETHPETSLTDIIFNVFSEDDLSLYQSRFNQLTENQVLSLSTNPSLSTNSPLNLPSTPILERQSSLISLARSWLKSSSRLIISAGAGLSASTGLDYTSPTLFSKHLWGFKRYGFDCLYSVFGYSDWPSEAARWSYFMNHLATVRSWPRSKLYDDLRLLVERKFDGAEEEEGGRWFVRTSNADGFFAKHGFDPARITTPQGQYAFVQCASRCREDAVWPSQPLVDAALRHMDPATQHLPADFEVPTCAFCRASLTLCVRGGSYFIEAPFDEQEERYAAFVEECMSDDARNDAGDKGFTTILELGVGMNTPSVLRWHNDGLVEQGNGKFKLIRLGFDAAGCVDPELEKRGLAVGLYGDITRLFKVAGVGL
ncbi:macro domain-like protein [Whalleya microplaca]|nr:macro domain-like protein [Whalleya microplaca]